MASERQIAANRRSAVRSTGPRTVRGKLRSRRNAYRHGLTAETVIASIEEPGDYRTFEAGVLADYAPQSMVERELVARLASLFWRLRRATLIETGLFEMQGGILQQRHRDQLRHEATQPELQVFYRILHSSHVTAPQDSTSPQTDSSSTTDTSTDPLSDIASAHRRKIDTASAYLALCRNNPRAMKRLGRYETTLWRQVAQTLIMLENARRNTIPFNKVVTR